MDSVDLHCPTVPNPYAWDSGTLSRSPGQARDNERDT